MALPVSGWMVEGKTIGQETIHGTVVRLGARLLEVRLDALVSVPSSGP